MHMIYIITPMYVGAKKKKQLHFALGKYVLGDLPTI